MYLYILKNTSGGDIYNNGVKNRFYISQVPTPIEIICIHFVPFSTGNAKIGIKYTTDI